MLENVFDTFLMLIILLLKKIIILYTFSGIKILTRG